METYALTYVGDAALEYIPEGRMDPPAAGEAAIRPLYTGICGTDLLILHGGHSRATAPVVLGHEFAGVVVAVGEDVADLRVGQTVVVEPLLSCGECRACLSGRYNQCPALRLYGVDVDGSLGAQITVPVTRVIALPERVDARAGAFVEPTAVACHLLRRLGPLDDRAAVFVAGGGPIGLIAAELLVARGHRVLLSEPNEFRARIAADIGASIVSSADEAISRARQEGLEIAGCIEATGVAQALAACVEVAAPGGVVAVVGLPKSVPQVDITAVIAKELDIRGSRVYTRADFVEAIEAIEAGTLQVSRHITTVVPFDEAISAGFDVLERREPVLKVMIDQTGAARV